VRWWLLVLVGCGRIGFDPTEPAAPKLAEVCGFDNVTVIENGIAVDDAAGAQLAAALASGCTSSPTERRVSQDDPGILAGDGRPLLPRNDLAVIGGGDGPNRAIAYLLRDDTPLVWTDKVTIRERASDRLIVDAPTSETHDYLMVMIVVEPLGGASVLSGQGGTAPGTAAAVLWFATVLAPRLATTAAQWFVVEWTDDDPTAGPSTDDTFTVLDSG